MKKLLVFIGLAFVLALSTARPALAQNSFQYEYYDTLDNATAIYYYIDNAGMVSNDYYISTTLQADSVSGSTAGVAYFQISNHATGNYWITLFQTTINGVQTVAYTEDILSARRARLYVTGGGTQRTYVRFAIHAVKRSYF